MNVESYACDFLRMRGYRAGRDYSGENFIDKAARALTEEMMQLKLSDLRSMAAMAQFSEREVRSDILRLIETTGDLPGDMWVSMDATSVKIIGQKVSG